ncbi:alpha/beta hydrolase [Macrococcus equipercicus]|uniref:Esterase family protein n=1 Tax=Macrococcus equipercicus TaxID=69967 RepID=A0A9Q9BUP4_9STAP|nr:alpha/beta hydrolase-fold protein [Macrococcus equipercicus]UTH14466.1 esterase family protein [Macrococcus equipercicus]
MFQQGLVNPHELVSKHLNRTVKFGIYLPKNYTSLYKHHVIITFDGQDFSQLGQLHRCYEKLYAADEIERAIIIYVHYPDVQTRKREYHPDSPDKQHMIKFITNELMPYIDQNFATLKTGNARLVMGDSLAASISLSLVLSYPLNFSRALLLSPMITATINEELAIANTSNIDLYHVIGLEENSFKLMTGEEADFLTPNQAFHDQLISLGVTTYYEELDGGHTWKTWKPQLELVLKYFLSK